jgi:predicted PurR-regulated permease PerM
MKRLALLTAAVLATALGAILLWQFRGTVVLFALALGLAAALRPAVDALRRRSAPAVVAIGVPYGLGMLVLGGLAFLVCASLAGELPGAARAALAAYEHARLGALDGGALGRALGHLLPPVASLAGASGNLGALASGAFGMTLGALDVVSSIGVVIGLGMFWEASRGASERLVFSVVPPRHRAAARETYAAVEGAVGAQVRAEIGEAVVVVVVLAAAFHALGLEYVMLPAVVAAAARLVPLVGPPLVVAGVVLAGLAVGPLHAALAGVATAVTLVALHVAMRRGLALRRYSAILSGLVAVMLADTCGLVGLLLAPVVAVALQVLLEQVRAQRPAAAAAAAAAAPAGGPDLSALRRRLLEVRSAALRTSRPPAGVAGLIRRLDRAIVQARRHVGRQMRAPAPRPAR